MAHNTDLVWNVIKEEQLPGGGGVTAHDKLTGLDYDASGHTGFARDTDIPSSLPANGGNADTVGGKLPSAFAPSGFGLGSYLQGVIKPVDEATITGMYYSPSADQNKPVGVVDGAVFVMAYSSIWVTQLFIDWRNNRSYTRVRNNGIWSGWVELLSDMQRDYTLTLYGGVATYNNWLMFSRATGTSAGMIRIKIPEQNIMFDADITLKAYNRVARYFVSGYTYTTGSPNWHQPAAVIQAYNTPGPLRFATDVEGNRYILIGTPTSSWGDYLQVTVPRVSVNYLPNNILERWEASLVTSEEGLTINATFDY